jgi:hypothetical protein
MKTQFRTNPENLASQILYREGLNKFDVVEMIVQDYYANIPVENTHSVWLHFTENVLKRNNKKIFTSSIEKLLWDSYHKNVCGNLRELKESVYSFMEEVDLIWSIDYVGDFQDFVMDHTSTYLDRFDDHVEWALENIPSEDEEIISTDVWNSNTESLPS